MTATTLASRLFRLPRGRRRAAAEAAAPPDTPTPPAATPRRWWREPLLHFLALGAALFAIDHALVAQRDDPRTIVVGRQVDEEAERVFVASRGRAPDADERAALRRVWLDNEVLYREGIALQVDRGDDAIRQRVIFKALSVVDANVKLPAHDDATLRAWFDAHRARYDEPARFDFQEAALAGEAGEAAVRAFVAQLNAGAPGDAQAGLRVYKARPAPSLAPSFGAEFAAALERATPGDWQALPTRAGWRAIRVDAVSAARPASFEALRGPVLQDWTDATLAEQRSAAVQQLAKKYRIVAEGAR